MSSKRPERIAINHDDYHAEHIGKLSDGRQFFLTTPFEPEMAGKEGCEYIVLFLFQADGRFLEAQIERFGSRNDLDQAQLRAAYQERFAALGEVSLERIEVEPFFVKRFGTRFGLIAQEPESDEEEWCVELHPGNYMAFYEPWDSGEYDT